MELNKSILEKEPIITKPIDSFHMSIEFDRMCMENNFNTYGDVLINDTNQLLSKPGFNYRLLIELLNFLSSINRKHLLKDWVLNKITYPIQYVGFQSFRIVKFKFVNSIPKTGIGDIGLLFSRKIFTN